MKSLKYLLISLLAIIAANDAYACAPSFYSVSELYMYRVYNMNTETQLAVKDDTSGVGQNCREWQKLTSETIPLEDIYKVVYTMSLDEVEKIYDNPNLAYDNKLVEWITKKDRSLLEFLYLAKSNEHIRAKRSSRWYYPSMKIKSRMSIEEIADKALAATDARLRDRYILQATRALFSLQRYNECIALWESEASKLPADNQMRQMIQAYVAGAEFHTNNVNKAIKYYAQIGDIESVIFCSNKTGKKLSEVEALKVVCAHNPNSHHVTKTLQKLVRQIEPDTGGVYGSGWLEFQEERRNDMVSKLLPLCLEMAKSSKTENPAMWYYTAAFMSDLVGNTSKANSYLTLAEGAKSSDFIDQSIKVMRIYLTAKNSKYDSTYEAKLFEEIKWLDNLIVNNIDDEVRKEVSRGYALCGAYSFYYWNDMMRRIILSEVCPRMIKAGKTTRALQLANMADNRLLGLVDAREDVYYENVNGEYKRKEIRYTMTEYRYADDANSFDYSNHFFDMIDSLGVNSAKRYLQRVEEPKSEFDHFLNARSYVNKEYLNDIIGTLCLREMRYGEAVKHLNKVSDKFNKYHLNTNEYMRFDPFSMAKKSISKEQRITRYKFAREMHSLEQKIEHSTDPNEKAKAMVRFATGLRNSFDICWPLTQYYCGYMFAREWMRDKYTKAAHRKVEQMVAEACKIVTDKEVAAEINYELCNFKTIAEQYPDTQKGKLVRGKCDKLYDYHAEKKSPAGYHYKDSYNWYK